MKIIKYTIVLSSVLFGIIWLIKFEQQQYHFDENMKLQDTLGKITDKYIDSTNFYYERNSNKSASLMTAQKNIIQ
jgi:hypothetical protein